jgi:outer membrane protein OmpA-like peptidoglycan-associated protein
MIDRIACSLLLAIMLVVARSAAQERPAILFGPVVGLDAALLKSRIPVYAGSYDCGEFGRGSGARPSAGGAIVLPSLFGGPIGLAGSATVGMASGEFTAPPAEPVRVVDDRTGELVQLDRFFALKYRETSIALDLLARYGLGEWWSLSAGASFGYRLRGSFSQSDNVRGPGNYRFPDGRSEHEMAAGAAPVAGGLTYGPSLLAACEIPFAGSALLEPGISVRMNLASPVAGMSWREYEIGGRVALLFGAGGASSAPAPVPPSVLTPEPPAIAEVSPLPIQPVAAQALPEPAPKPRPRLRASIDLAGLDTVGRRVPIGRVVVNELLYRRVAPLLPAIFFDRDSVLLPGRYAALTSREADAFSIDSLSTVDLLDLQHHTLDVIGARMRRDRSARLALAGSVSKDEEGSLAGLRVETVAGYLRDVWGIDRSRISLRRGGFMGRSNEATGDGRADNRRVELSSNVEAITAPVLTERVARDFNPPAVIMSPAIDAEAGVKSWHVELRQNGNIVARYSGTGPAELDPASLRWRLSEDALDAGLAPLVAELSVEDSAGGVTTASAEVPLTMEKRVNVVDGRIERSGNRERIAYTLVGFDFNSSGLDRANRSSIGDIAAITRGGAHVAITGYTDRIGDEGRNDALSAERAAHAAVALREALERRGVHGVTIETKGAGTETDRFTNDLPEGRVLSRGVLIVVEQNVEDGR